MKVDLIIKNGRVATEGKIIDTNIYVSGGKIVALGTDAENVTAERTVDAAGKYVFPGFIDPHVHLNDPGLTNSEDFYTGSCAAAAGGVSTVLEHPLTFPLPDNLKDFNEKKALGRAKSIVNFCLFGAISEDNDNEIPEILESGAVAFKTFLPYSPEIPSLDDGRLFEKMSFMADKDTVLAIHCENNAVVEYYTAKMRREGKVAFSDYPKGRPPVAEIEAVSRMCLFSKLTGCRINIAHCTLKDAVDIVEQSKKEGVKVTVETCPHYLILDDSMMDALGAYSICNPPLRSREEVEKLWECVLGGKIDWLCSDHATYTVEEKTEKQDNAFDVPAGTTSVETCFQLLFSEGVKKRRMSIEKFVELSSTNAAKAYGLYPQKGVIRVGSDADLTIFDTELHWTVHNSALKQMIKWSPYEGMELCGRVSETIVNGITVYKDGEIVAERGSGRFVRPCREG